MAESLVLCSCRLAKDTVDVHSSTGQLTTYTCEHCDQPCTERRCAFCVSLFRSNAKA